MDWLNLLNWLAVKDHVIWLHCLMKKEEILIFPYPEYDDMAFNRTIRPHAKGWKIEAPARKPHIVATPELSGYLAEVEGSQWLNLMIGHQRPMDELVSQGVSVAASIAACFNSLLPVYENRSPTGSG
jgi:hypothetical protein